MKCRRYLRKWVIIPLTILSSGRKVLCTFVPENYWQLLPALESLLTASESTPRQPVPDRQLIPPEIEAARSEPSSQTQPLPGKTNTFASFAHRNYRLWFTGQAFSLIGTWMQSTAQGFLVYQLTNSPAYLGYVGFASGIPMWLFSLYGGVISDRVSRRNLMIVTQTVMMVLAFVLGGLTFAGIVMPWEIVLLSFLNGIANAFDAPARQAIVAELVSREDMGNAIALNATMFNLGITIGPAIAGLAYAALGPAWCFTINGISFLAVIVALAMMDIKPAPDRIRQGSRSQELREGLRYVIATPAIGLLILTITVVTVFGVSFATLLPAWAVQILHGDSATNGFLQSARGLGSLLGALIIASMARTTMRGKVLTIGTLVYPALILLWAFTSWLPLSLLILVGTGVAMMFVTNIANILVQSQVPDQLRGRVMGIYSLGFFGMLPIGSMIYGAAAEWVGEQTTVIACASVALVFGILLFIFAPSLRKME
jgi:MFS family permease